MLLLYEDFFFLPFLYLRFGVYHVYGNLSDAWFNEKLPLQKSTRISYGTLDLLRLKISRVKRFSDSLLRRKMWGIRNPWISRTFFFLGRGSQEWEISFHFSGSRRDDRMKRDVDTRYGNPSDNPNVLQAMRRMTSVDFGRSGISFPHPPCIAIDILGLISSMNVRESNVHSRIIWTF